MADSGKRLVTLNDLIDALDKRERAPSNVPKVETFHFKGDRVSDWLDLTEQALVGLSDEINLQRVLRYVLHSHHREVRKVVDASGGSWTKFGDLMRRKYRLGDGLLTMADLEAMNKEDFSTIGAFMHGFKKKARKVHGILEEAKCATFLGLLTGSEAAELTKHGEGSEKLTWATIDKGVEEGSLDQVEQHQMRLQRRKRKERDATASGTPGVKRIVTDVLAALGYDSEAELQKRGVAAAQTRGQSRATAGQGPSQAPGRAPPRREPEPERRKEVVEVQEEEEEGDDEEEERLRQEEDQRAEQRAKKRGIQGAAEPSLHDGAPKRKKYVVRLEEGFDVERMVEKLLEGHNDLMNLKDILASAPRLRGELKGALTKASAQRPPELDFAQGDRVDRGGHQDGLEMCGVWGRRPDVKKTDKILKWSVPFQSITDVRSFLGTCGFWRSFVKDFATKTEHLRKLVRQDQEWVWGEDQEKVVERMKVEFKEGGLVLGAPNYEATEEKPFVVETDAGPTALGGVLIQADADGKERPLRSDFSKAVMQRGGRDTRPRQGPLRAAGGGEQHEPPRTEPTPTPEFDDDNIEFFLDVYRDHAAQRGWSMAERIHHLRGIGRFEEPVAQICEEALTWPDVEAGMQRLRASPRGRDGMPIRLEEGNAEEFIPTYEHYMLSQGIAREEWMKALLIWTRGAERPVARQIRERARDWEDCQAQLRRAFGRPERERPKPRVERRRRSKRPREPAPREVGLARERRRAPAQREDEPTGPALAEESFPACGLRAVEFRRITSEELRPPSPLPSGQEMDIPGETPFRNLATHLTVSRWEASRLGEGSVEPTRYVPLEEPLDPETEMDTRGREEPQDPEMAAKQPDPVRPQGGEVITVGDDTPPCSPVPEPAQHSWPEGIPKPGSEEIPEFPPETTAVPEQEVEMEEQGAGEGARMEAIYDLPSVMPTIERPAIEEPVLEGLPSTLPSTSKRMGAETSTPEGRGPRVRGAPRETREEKSAGVRVRLDELHARQAEMEASGIEPTPPVEPKTSEQRIDELWARYESQIREPEGCGPPEVTRDGAGGRGGG
ncbi:hypothetical protein CBR_g30375 [Chara braunii]|uniref:Reverse transcriptase/retrotransposon-derived protein RNase H-like domain-containing protein n=1 Tax=Chara braunii TaxID=69332 RepID=A0A388JXF6_CHABU|nr:hypothetical protein CBR_g30375 [Chara braunii]|eukprot:GBG62422.1 hypothetical protein CBR_g30375 [Chara braunii]